MEVLEVPTEGTAAKGLGEKKRKSNTGPPEEDDVLSLGDKILSIELISREVFRSVEFKNLLNCSLVNRTWRASARLHLRTHCRCFFSFSPQAMELKQRKLSDLHDLLTNSSDVPFNGVCIATPFQFQPPSFHSYHEDYTSSSEDLPREDLTSSSEDVTFSPEGRTSSSSDITSSLEDSTCSSEDLTSSLESEKTSSDESVDEGNAGKELQETAEEKFISALEWERALGRMEVKYLELDWRGEPDSTSSRVAIKEILRRSSSSLVDLTVLGWDDPKGLILLLHFFGVDVLPNVKVLQLPGTDWRRPGVVDLKKLLNALPRLQSIRGPVDLLSLPAFLATSKHRAIREFNFSAASLVSPFERRKQKAVKELLEIAATFAWLKPKLTKLILATEFESIARRTPEKYFSVIEALVRGGAEVLKEVKIGHRNLLSLISSSYAQLHSPPLFPAATRLAIHFEFGTITDFRSATLNNLNLEAHFPLLHSVELDCVTGSHLVSSRNKRRTEEYCCKSVRRLVVRHTWRLCNAGMEATNYCMASFTRLFPMVRMLVMEDCSELQTVCTSLWGKGRLLWEELRVLRFEGIEEGNIRMNWDRLFTGISKEDCVRLKKRCEPDVQFFEELRLKPREEREGSLMDLKKLEKLQFGMEHDDVCETRRGGGKFFASTLIGECVWALMGLRVEIKRHLCQKQLKCCLALKHLQPFVHFVDKFTD